MQEVGISDLDVGTSLWYDFLTRRPVKKHEKWRFVVSAVLNVGWCQTANAHPWVKKGDYLSTQR